MRGGESPPALHQKAWSCPGLPHDVWCTQNVMDWAVCLWLTYLQHSRVTPAPGRAESDVCKRSWSISHVRALADHPWVINQQCPAVSGVLGSFPLSSLVTECQTLLLLFALLPALVLLSHTTHVTGGFSFFDGQWQHSPQLSPAKKRSQFGTIA